MSSIHGSMVRFMDLCLQYIEKSPVTNIKFTFFTGNFSMYCIHTVYIYRDFPPGRTFAQSLFGFIKNCLRFTLSWFRFSLGFV